MEKKNLKKSRLVKQLLLVMAATSMITIVGSAAIVSYVNQPLVENITITPPSLSFEHSINGQDWTTNPLSFTGQGGDTIGFSIRVINNRNTPVPAAIMSKISCIEGLTMSDFQSITINISGNNIPLTYTPWNATTLLLSYNVTIPNNTIITAPVSIKFVSNAYGHYQITNQITPK